MPRCIVTATITFGLVSIPVKLYTAASAVNVEFNMLTPAGNRVKQKLVDAVTGEPVDRDKTLKGYEVSKGQYVTFTQAEIKAAEGEKSNVMDIAEFVPANTIDPLQIEKSYYLGPDKGGDKGYSLLAQKLATMGMVAVASWPRNGKERLVVIRPYRGGLMLHEMFYADEVRDFDEVLDTVAKVHITPAEDALAEKLIGMLANPAFLPEKYEDGYRRRVNKIVEAKIAGKMVTVEEVKPVPVPMIDLAALLAESLGKTKKLPAEVPPKKEAATTTEEKSSRKRGGRKAAGQTPV